MGTSKKKSEGRSRQRHRDDSDDDRKESRHRKHSKERENSHDRERSRSRDRDRDRHRGDRGRWRDRSRDREKRRHRDRDRSKKSPDYKKRKEESSRRVSEDEEEQGGSKRDKRACIEDEVQDLPVPSSSTGESVSLSIEETNKLRIKLGLKPLEMDSGPNKESNNGEISSETFKNDPVHAPPKNIGKLKEAEKLKEKMVTMKETRNIAKNLNSLKTLGESDSEDDEDASTWIKRARQREEEKIAAEKKARMLAEMDEQFGIGELMSSTIKQRSSEKYSSADLKGLTVQHTTEAFQEDREIVLTLKDAGVLDEAEDVLVNVNIIDSEKAVKNIETKKGSKYNPYDKEEVDEFGNVKEVALLNKYDEEIEGEKKKSFKLGASGDVDTSEERQRMIIKEKLEQKQISLAAGSSHIASEYYTSEEMVQFKKPKKKRKVRKKLKADDLVPLETSEDLAKDHGSRSRDNDGETKTNEDSMDVGGPEQAVSLKDEDDSAVETALLKTRRLLQRGKQSTQGAAKVVSMLQHNSRAMDTIEHDENESYDAIVLNITAEFCRQVGEEEKKEPSKEPEDQDQDDEAREDEVAEMNTTPQIEVDNSEGGWSEVKMDVEEKQKPKVDDLYQEEEPMASSSLIAALQVAARKGFIPTEAKQMKNDSNSKSDAHRDREYEKQKERERERELSKYERDGSFPEKKGYIPDVRIIHVDDAGHELSIKEAFRFMSHKFHGKGSGKKKTEKRLKKFQAEEYSELMRIQLRAGNQSSKFLKSSSSVDTPLNTLSMLKTKQKQSQSPYILVKGAGAQSLQAPDIGKRK